jgi:hypothetical protein
MFSAACDMQDRIAEPGVCTVLRSNRTEIAGRGQVEGLAKARLEIKDE